MEPVSETDGVMEAAANGHDAPVRISRKRLARYRAYEAALVELGVSSLLAAKLGLQGEMGVFARATIPAGSVVGIYYGPLYTNEEINALYQDRQAKYTLASDTGYSRDCADATQSTLMRYINSNRGLGLPPSVAFEDRDKCRDFVVRALQDIEPGEELLVCYGPAYFSDNDEEEEVEGPLKT